MMKTIINSLLFITFLIIISISCEEDKNEDISPVLDEFCSVVPNEWDCEIITDNFSINDIPQNADIPIAIIKYINANREFTRYVDTKVNPSLILDFYSIKQKNELIDFVKSQQLYSWCIPIYYGETKDYFIVTSPCFINQGSFTEEAESCINDLHEALKSIITINDYNFIAD